MAIPIAPANSNRPKVTPKAARQALKAISQIGDMTLVVEIIDVMTFDDDGKIQTMLAYWAMEDAHPV